MLKHRLKLFLREAYARVLFHTGLCRLVDRLMPRRMTVLFGHCVDAPEVNGFLPPDMKIRAENLTRILAWFGRRFELCTIGAGFERLRSNQRGTSLVALSMDDGYRDNQTALQPLLARLGAKATVFLESRPLDEQRVNWSHKYFWVLDSTGDARALGQRYVELSEEPRTKDAFREILARGDNLEYRLKRVLKYDADVQDRDRVLDRIFAEHGGDERALCAQLYLDWDGVRALHAAGFELGGHTITHPILSRLTPAEAEHEARGCADSLARELEGWRPTTYAYPFGRKWDYNQASIDAARAAGWNVAVNTHAGTNGPATDPMQLLRIPIDDTSALHLLAAEACGGFDLLRRLGLDLSE